MTLNDQLQQLQQQVLHLLKQFQQAQKTNVQLQRELDKTSALLQEKNEQIQHLQQKVDVLKLGKSSWSDEERMVLEKRIAVYLKEIDKCLTLLNA